VSLRLCGESMRLARVRFFMKKIQDSLKQWGDTSLKKGAGKEVPKYTILGACNPDGAYQALQIEEQIGVMLPCNVIVRETSTGKVEVAAINPQKTMQSIGNPNMIPLATEISDKLKNVLNAL